MERHGKETYFVVGEGVFADEPVEAADRAGAGGSRPSLAATTDAAAPAPFRFSRMGPKGTAPGKPARVKLAVAMTAGGGGPSGVPSGYTYLGQFIDHDLTSDRTKVLLGHNVSPAELLQARSPSLDLDSLYGAGPQQSGLGEVLLRRPPPQDGQDGRRRRDRCEGRLRPAASRDRVVAQGQARRGDPGLPQRREPRRRADAPGVHPVPQPGRRQPAGVCSDGAAIPSRAGDRRQALPVDDPSRLPAADLRARASWTTCSPTVARCSSAARDRPRCRRCRSSSRSLRSAWGTA